MLVRDAVALGSLLAGMLLPGCPCAFALNPALDINQYAHTAWRAREGFAKGGAITAIAQTPDGYLWLGTEFGLLRFDGIRTTPWNPPDRSLPSSIITRLLTGRDGTLWIGTRSGLHGWKDGRLTRYAELTERMIFNLVEDRDGVIWAGTGGPGPGRLCAIEKAMVQCHGDDGRFGVSVLSSYVDRNGTLWAGSATGLWRWKPGPPQLFPMPNQMPEIQALIDGDNGALWISLRGGIRQFVDGKAETLALPAFGLHRAATMFRDRGGSLWMGVTAQGIVHVHGGRTDVFTSTDGLSGDSIYSLFEDREGTMWVATNNGLDRFREVAVPTLSFLQGLSRALIGSLAAAKDGSVWLASFDGLNHWNKGQVTIYRHQSSRPPLPMAPNPASKEILDTGLPDNSLESMFLDDRGRVWVGTPRGVAYLENGRFTPVRSLPGGIMNFLATDAAGDMWVANMYQGLFHLSGGVAEQIPWAKLKAGGPGSAIAPDPGPGGGVWLGFFRGGLVHFKDGQVRASYTARDGLGTGQINGLHLDRDGTLWAATAGGLSRLVNGRWATLTTRNGLPCDDVHWAIDDDAQSSWLYMPCGLMRITRKELEDWSADPRRTVHPTVFDSSDGVTVRANAGGYNPRVAKAADGKLWFSTFEGVSVVDPNYLPTNKLPPPVHIEQVLAGHKPYEMKQGLLLPALVGDLQIDYTALSLAAPERVRFRYKLEGHDRDWLDVGNRRQAFYNDLAPRKYRFRVIASNNNGVWNETGAFLDFAVAPAYYQTTLFRLSCVGALLALLGTLYRLRLHQVAQKFQLRMEERVNERTRIARDLHDTLLQSFQGVLLKFQAITYQLPDRPEARTRLETVIEEARHAITEGRDAVEGLRSSTVLTNDLARAITIVGQELASHPGGNKRPDFQVQVEGTSRELVPLVRDEVYRVAGEALRNAFRHAGAQRIEVEIRYDQRQLRLRVRDDGKGIDTNILDRGGRSGHHGLPGMHERSKLVGGKLSIWSQRESGTEIELIVPARIAYAKASGVRGWTFWSVS